MIRVFFILFFVLGVSVSYVPSAPAQVSLYVQDNDDYFEKYVHESNLFRLLMPKGHQTKTRALRTSDTALTYFTEVQSVQDRRPIHNSVKTYTVTMTQTLGGALEDDDLPLFLDGVVKSYVDTYKDRLGYLNKETRKLFDKRPGVEIVMTYQDPELGEQGLRAQVLFSNYSRLDVVFTGPTNLLFSNQTERYFKSLEFFNGKIKNQGSFTQEWVPYRPQSDVYTTFVPPRTEPYFPHDPVVKSGSRVELTSMRFFDPVWKQFLFYNIHAYRFKAPIDAKNAKKIIYSRHLDKFDVNIRKIRYRTTIEGSDEFFETQSKIFPPPGFDYLDQIKVRARVFDNVLLVQEIVGPSILLNTWFPKLLFDMIDFHPLGHGKTRPMDEKSIPDFITDTVKQEPKKMDESLMEVLGVE